MEHTVFFPGLGLEFTMNPVAFTLFGHNINWYGVIIAVGFLLAVAYCYRKAPQFGVDGETLIDMLFFAVPDPDSCSGSWAEFPLCHLRYGCPSPPVFSSLQSPQSAHCK